MIKKGPKKKKKKSFDSARVLKRLLKDLDKEGFVMNYYKSFSTKSCYIKLDYGMSNSIRISDHDGKKKYNYRFNLMLNSKVSYVDANRRYYCYNDYEILIKDIVNFRNEQVTKYGKKYYKTMLFNKYDSKNRTGFWLKSINYNDFVNNNNI